MNGGRNIARSHSRPERRSHVELAHPDQVAALARDLVSVTARLERRQAKGRGDSERLDSVVHVEFAVHVP